MDPIIVVTTQTVTDPQTPTPSHYDEIAGQMMTALDVFAAAIPKLEESEIQDPKQVRRNLNVPDAFCYTAVSAAEQLPELEVKKNEYAEKNRNRLQYIAAFGPVYDKLTAVSLRVRHGLRANKSAVAGDSLVIYRLLQAELKSTRNPALAAHTAALKRDLAKRVKTAAEREEKKAAKLMAAVEEEIARRQAKGLLTVHQPKEVTAQAA